MTLSGTPANHGFVFKGELLCHTLTGLFISVGKFCLPKGGMFRPSCPPVEIKPSRQHGGVVKLWLCFVTPAFREPCSEDERDHSDLCSSFFSADPASEK